MIDVHLGVYHESRVEWGGTGFKPTWKFSVPPPHDPIPCTIADVKEYLSHLEFWDFERGPVSHPAEDMRLYVRYANGEHSVAEMPDEESVWTFLSIKPLTWVGVELVLDESLPTGGFDMLAVEDQAWL